VPRTGSADFHVVNRLAWVVCMAMGGRVVQELADAGDCSALRTCCMPRVLQRWSGRVVSQCCC